MNTEETESGAASVDGLEVSCSTGSGNVTMHTEFVEFDTQVDTAIPENARENTVGGGETPDTSTGRGLRRPHRWRTEFTKRSQQRTRRRLLNVLSRQMTPVARRPI